jgi:hypothetical protein
MASLESYAQQADTVLLDGLSYNLSPSAPYIIDRRSITYLTSSAGTFRNNGVNNFKISMTSAGGDFADLHTARLTFRIKNAALDNGQPDLAGVAPISGTVNRLMGPTAWSDASRCMPATSSSRT